MSGWHIKALDKANVGSSIQPMISSGAPAATAASSTIRAAAQVHSRARGWGLMLIPLRVLRLIRVLKIAVEVGFVVGMIPQIMPTGSAMVMVPASSSCSRMPQVLRSLYLL